MNELELIVQRMVEAGETEDNIRIVIENFEPSEGLAKTTDGVVSASAPSGPLEAPERDMESVLESGFVDSFSNRLPEQTEIEVESQKVDVDVNRISKRYNNYQDRMDAVGKAAYKEEFKRISNLQANITEEQITEKQANDYFNLSARPFETVIDTDAPMSTRGGGFGGASEMPKTRKEYQPIESYLGPEKYKQYQQYQETGQLISDGTSENQALIQEGRSQARYGISKQIAEQELRNVPENVQRFFGDAPIDTVDDAEGYLEFQKNKIESMAAQNKEQYASYQEDAAVIEEKFLDVKRRIEEIGKPDSQEKVDQYNELVVEGNAINSEYAAGKFTERYNSIVKQQQLVNSEFETFKSKSQELDDRFILEKAASLDYSFSARAGMAMEEFFIKDMYNNFGTLIKEVGLRGVEQAMGIQGAAYAPMFDDAVETMRQANQNYNLQIASKRENTIPESLKLDDIGNNNIGYFDWFTEAFADNSPSIVTTFIPGGAAIKGGIALKSAAKIGTFAAKKAALQSQRAWGTAAMYTARGAFFGGGTGGKFGDIELTEANAKLQLVKLRSAMQGTEDLAKKKELQDEIDELERISSFSLTQKAFTSFAFGTAETLAESLGSLKLVTGASRVAKSMGKQAFKKEVYGRPINFAANVTGKVVSGLSPLVKGGAVELLEEGVTQIAHNGIDIIVLGENKSLIDGLDKDFIANVLVTSGGIMAPKTAGNVVNILKNEFRIKSELKANQELVVELVNLSAATPNMSKPEQLLARTRKAEILEKLALNDAISLHKLRYMTSDQIDKAADLSRQAREIGNELYKLGASGEGSTTSEGQKAKARLQEQLDNVITQKESLLNAKDRKLREEAAAFFEENDGPLQNRNGEFEYYSGLFDFYQDTAMSLMPKNGKYISIKDISNLDSDLAGFSEQAIAEVKAGFENGARAAVIGNSIVINEASIKQGLASANNFVDGKYAAIAPLEELFHLFNKANGITKGGELDKMSIAAVDEAITVLKNKKELGQISEKEYNNLIARFEAYKTSGRGKVVLKSGERGGAKVDSEEILAQINNAIALGVFNREDISNIPSLRGFINGVSNSIFGDSSWMFNLKTAEDVFKFAENFQKSIEDNVAVDASPEEEDINKFSLSAEDSAKVNELYETQGDAALMDVVDLMEPTAKGLADSYRNRPKFSEFKDQLKDEILTGKRGMMETVMDYPAYVEKQETERQSLIKQGKQKEADKIKTAPLSGYINNSFSTKTGFKRYVEIADRILGKDEQSQFTQELNEEATSVLDEDANLEAETVEPTKERESLRKKIELTPEVTQKVRDAVSKTFGTKLPDIDSREFKMALQKAFRTELKTTMAKDVMGSRAAYETFLRDNFETIFEVIPQSVMNKRFKAFVEPVLDSSGKRKREKTAQGNPISKKKPISKAEFIKYFLGSEVGTSTKGTRKDALAEALAEEFAFDATMETIQTEDVAIKREFLDKGQTTEKVSKKIDRPSTMKFSKAVRDLDLGYKQEFYTKLNDIGKSLDNANIDLNNKDAWKQIREVMKPILGDKFPKLTEIAKDLYKYSKLYDKIEVQYKNTKTLPEVSLNRFLYNAVEATETDANIMKLLDLGKTKMTTLFDNKDNIVRQRLFIKELGNHLINTGMSPAKVAKLMVSYYKGMYATSSKIGDGKFKVDKDGNIVDSSVKSKTPRYQVFENVGDFIKNAVTQIKGLENIELTPSGQVKNKQTINGVEVDFELFAESSAAALKDRDFAGRKKQAKEARESIDLMMNFMVDKIKDAKSIYSKQDLAMLMASMKSNMQGPIKRAANLKYIYEGARVAVGDLRYEHMIPTNYVLLKLVDFYMNNEGEARTSKVDQLYEEYTVAVIPKTMDKVLEVMGLEAAMPFNYLDGDSSYRRYYNVRTFGAKSIVAIKSIDPKDNGKIIGQKFVDAIKTVTKAAESNNAMLPKIIKYSKGITIQQGIDALAKTDRALDIARDLYAPVKKIRVFDFDDTLAQTKSNVLYTMPDGTTGKIDAATFAKEAGNMEAKGVKWDFSEFSKVMQGTKGPLLDVAKIIADKRGTDDVFVLTARPANAAGPIKEFLASMGLDIPLANITGLGDGAPAAKAGWIMGKASEGYNDFYFADDHTGNVKAVKDVLSKIDVKSKVQLAKVKFSKSLDADFNKIIENKTGIAAEKNYAKVKAEVVGANKGRFNFFIPPSAEDFVGLLYSTLGKGSIGDSQMAWYKKHLLNPYARAMESITRDRNALGRNFKALKKELKIVPRDLKKKIPGEPFTREQAVRVYIWNQLGMDVPGISKQDLKELTDIVNKDNELRIFAEEVMKLNKGTEYVKPKDSWTTGTITTDLLETLNTTKRKQYLEQWQQNVDVIFSEKNLNKLQAAYGKPYRLALENILNRMATGRNKTISGDNLTGRLTDWLTGSIGAIMFFNTRSAVLQTLSAVNFINFGVNNIFAASKAFANQPQYWKDFKMLFNSDFLVERRDGLKFNVNEADIANIAKERGVRGVINKLLKLGFTPTQIADSFAIAAGGSTFYRNTYNALVESGMNEEAAKKQAMRDFREIAEESQQSSRPDRISQQQAGPLGRVILAFANTPAQYARLIKKAASDLKNGRGSAKVNISKIVYYGFAQNLVFNALQQALFAVAFGDEEDEDDYAKTKEGKQIKIVNGMLDSILRGTGLGGAVFSVVKNASIKFLEEDAKKNPKMEKVVKEFIKISPPISSKLAKMSNAARSYSWDKKEMAEGGFGLDNPAYLAGGNVVSAATNIPLDRVIKKINNIKDSSREDLEVWQRMALIGGWSDWELGIEDEDKKEKSTSGNKVLKRNVLKRNVLKRSVLKRN